MADQPSKNEDESYAKRDAELLRQRRASAQAAAAERRSHRMKCPKRGYDLITGAWPGIQLDQCTPGHGLWLDAAEAERLVAHPEPGSIGRVFRTVLRGAAGQKVLDP